MITEYSILAAFWRRPPLQSVSCNRFCNTIFLYTYYYYIILFYYNFYYNYDFRRGVAPEKTVFSEILNAINHLQNMKCLLLCMPMSLFATKLSFLVFLNAGVIGGVTVQKTTRQHPLKVKVLISLTTTNTTKTTTLA
jgi:hypothetical protein